MATAQSRVCSALTPRTRSFAHSPADRGPPSLMRAVGRNDSDAQLTVILFGQPDGPAFSAVDATVLDTLVTVAEVAVGGIAQRDTHRRWEQWMAAIDATADIMLGVLSARSVLESVLDAVARRALQISQADMCADRNPQRRWPDDDPPGGGGPPSSDVDRLGLSRRTFAVRHGFSHRASITGRRRGHGPSSHPDRGSGRARPDSDRPVDAERPTGWCCLRGQHPWRTTARSRPGRRRRHRA